MASITTADADINVDLDAPDAPAAAKPAKTPVDAPEKDPIEVVTAPETPPAAKAPILTPDEGLEKLKKQLDSERAGRIAAESRAQEASEAEVRARTEVQGTQLDLVKNALAQATENKATLKSRYSAALAAQDFDGAAEVQDAMADNAAKLLMFERAKTELEKAPKPTIRQPADPVEQFAAKLSPRSAQWVRANPEYVRDPRKNQEMLAAHALAMARGAEPDSPEYFTSIERTLGMGGDPSANGANTHIEIDTTGADDPTAQAAKPAQRRATPPAAPVSRAGNGQGSRSNVVTLSTAEQEMAANMFPESKNPALDYAKNKQILQREGKLN